MEGLPENPDVQSQRFVSSELPKLQRPLEPRDYSDSDLGISQALPKFENIPSILQHRGQTLLRKTPSFASTQRVRRYRPFLGKNYLRGLKRLPM